MSLATRCTSCSTVFRVVQDQLRVSSGWVRCGRCGEVFNAIESLVDLDVERPDGPASVHGPRVMEDLARVSGLVSPGEAQTAFDAKGVPGAEDRPSDAPAPDVTIDDGGPVATRVAPDTVTEEPDASPPALRDPAWSPTFVQQADRAARWRRSDVRAALVLGNLIAIGGLAWQVADTHHDWIAARWPVARTAMEGFCARSGCRVESPRLLDALAVDSSGLVRVPGAATIYRLAVTVRNRSDVRVLTPALDLVLSDTAGSVVARRVVTLQDLGEPRDSIGPRGELAASGLLRVDGMAVSGYTVEIFYP